MSSKARYEVRVVADAECTSVKADVLSVTNDLATAKRDATQLAGDYPFGGAIVDTETRMIDFGFGFADYASFGHIPTPEMASSSNLKTGDTLTFENGEAVVLEVANGTVHFSYTSLKAGSSCSLDKVYTVSEELLRSKGF